MSDSSAPPPGLSSVVDSHFAPPASPSGTAAPTKPSDAGGAAAATGQPSTTAAERRFAFKAKVDREERDIDFEADWADETKRKGHIETYQRGLAHDEVVKRERAAADVAGQKSVLARLTKQGYTWKQDATAEGGWRFVPPQTQAATPAPSLAPDDPIAKRIAELKAKEDADTITAAEIREFSSLERQRDERTAQAERTRREADDRTAGEKATYEKSVDDGLFDVLGAFAKDSDGVPEETANKVRSGLWKAIRGAAFANNVPADKAKEFAQGLLRDIEAAVEARVAHLTKPPAPSTAPPVHGGTAAGAAPAASTNFKNAKELMEHISRS